MTDKFIIEFNKGDFIEISGQQYRNIRDRDFEMHREYFMKIGEDILCFLVVNDYDEPVDLGTPDFIQNGPKRYIHTILWENLKDDLEEDEIAAEIERDVEEYRAKRTLELKEKK